MKGLMRRAVPKLAGAGFVMLLFAMAREPALSGSDRARLAGRFAFERLPLTAAGTPEDRTIRVVHPQVRHIAAWISSVGASVALADLDNDGSPNDYCISDPRGDRVIVGPVAGTSRRFEAFVVDEPAAEHPPFVAPMGCRIADLNEDGLGDVIVYYWGRPPRAWLQRTPDRDGTRVSAASFHAVDLAPPDLRWNTNALATADVDGDGHLDLVVGNYFPDGSRPLDATGADPFEMQASMARSFNGGRNRILLWSGASGGSLPGVAYRDVSDALPPEIADGWTLALAATDLDGDLLPELYFANDFGPDRLLHNRSRPGDIRFALVQGRGHFTTPHSKAIGRDSFKGMGVDVGDLNGDGWLDIFVSNIANEYALEESHFAFISRPDPSFWFAKGIAPYDDLSEELGLARSAFAWEARLADFDNDGVPEALQAIGFIRGTVDRWPELQELAMGNNLMIRHPASWPRFASGDDLSGSLHNPFFVRGSGRRYFDLAPDIGLGMRQVSRGIAVADIDTDGDLDYAVANQWETSYVFRNVGASAGTSLLLRPMRRVRGAPARWRIATGTHARVTLPGGQRLIAYMDGGNGHSGARAPEMHFGLGAIPAGTPVRVDFFWRDDDGVVRQTTRWLPAGAVDARHRQRGATVVLDE
jgi:hypothetical protein